MRAQHAATFMRAFGDPTRLRIVHALFQGPKPYAELARVLRCPKPRLTRHLRYLHARGVVDWNTVRGQVVYQLSNPRERLPRQVLEALRRTLGELAEVREDRGRLAQEGRG